jgi:hypothetical protein
MKQIFFNKEKDGRFVYGFKYAIYRLEIENKQIQKIKKNRERD